MVESNGQAARPRGGRPIYQPDPAAALVGESINAQGNLRALRRKERGRLFLGRRRGASRPAGKASPRMVTGVDPLDSITGPYLPRS